MLRVLVATGAVIALSLPGSARAQILNTLGGFDRHRPGLSGSAEGALSVSGGNTDILEITGAGRIQFQTGRERIRFLAAGTRKTSDGTEIDEGSVLHLRHNHRFRNWFSSLLFLQRQNDPFQRLRRRFLIGAGGRFDLVDDPTRYLAVGAAHMVEIERIEGSTGSDTDQRLSAFVTGSVSPVENVNLTTTAFVQPAWNSLGDLRALVQAGVRVRISGGLSLEQGLDYTYDAEPPDGVERSDWEIRTSVGYAF